MTTPIPTGYATVADYELRTGTDVPVEQEPTIQQRLNDTSSLIDLYLGPSQPDVDIKYHDILVALTVSHVYRVASVPTGVRSESVGGTSVSYDTEMHLLDLIETETRLLDALIEGAGTETPAAGVGQIGVTLGGPEEDDDEEIWLWVLSGGYRK